MATVTELLQQLVKLAEAGEDVGIEAHGLCDCGDHIRHNNGGNYHPRCWVRYDAERREFVVTFGNSREWFPGDNEYPCPVCEQVYRGDEDHRHIPINLPHALNGLAEEICQYIGRGSVYLWTDGGHSTVAAAYL
jgi:uncharacterized Zn-finger protein